ncbi:TIGR03862 family flavoprotein [Phenylobacterium sp. LjRoot164]|uniref:TIGR03862 family flavoprotein n=1 Tax=unclassified Phenylobacterium TaxID=2640670 RepID=UPI003ECDB06A
MSKSVKTAAVVGGGPAGLIAAEILSAAGVKVTLYDRMPTLGRKFLMAGRGGLNLTHSEDLATFAGRYGEAADWLAPMIEAFSPSDLQAWTHGLGQETFVGSSGRVFPKALKASPLLRAWLARLSSQGVEVRLRHEWRGWNSAGELVFAAPEGAVETVGPDATILALGGASWPNLGSTGSWTALLADKSVALAPFRSANAGFNVAWSSMFAERFAGEPLKNIALSFDGRSVRGEAMIAAYGIEGGAIYALSAELRETLARGAAAVLEVDLTPDLSRAKLTDRLHRAPGGQSTSNLLRKAAGLSPIEINLLREAHGVDLPREPGALARAIKAAPLPLTGMRPLERAISSAGGVERSALDEDLMLRTIPGVYAVGEMLDWEAPTGGYLLQACFATGVHAARSILKA